MKKICLFLVLLLPALACLAQEPYYITKAGTVLHYERYKASSGKRIQTTRIEVDSIVNTPDGQRVCYSLLLEKETDATSTAGRWTSPSTSTGRVTS